MPKFAKKPVELAEADGQDAPDPVDFARSQHSAPLDAADPIAIPALSGGEPTMAQALVLIAEALKTIKAGDGQAADRLAGIEKFLLHQEETRPHENLFNPPMISAFNPLGERDHPKPELQCKIIWVGYELTKDTLTRQEVELLNRLQPGSYKVTKADGRIIRFTVQAKVDDNDKREMLTIHFPCKGTEDSQNHASMVSYLTEALGDTATPDALHAQIAALKAQLATQSAGVVA